MSNCLGGWIGLSVSFCVARASVYVCVSVSVCVRARVRAHMIVCLSVCLHQSPYAALLLPFLACTSAHVYPLPACRQISP